MSAYGQRVRTVGRTLERLIGPIDSLVNEPDALAQADNHLKQIEESTKAFQLALQPTRKAPLLEDAEMWVSLASAVIAIARERRGARLTAKDLKDLVDNHCPRKHLAFWVAQYPGRVVGLLRSEPEVMKVITAGEVLCWERWEDEQWRIVNARTPSPEAVYAWVMGVRDRPGRRCALCGMEENDQVQTLLPPEFERRPNGVQTINGVVVLRPGVNTHPECANLWMQWLGIAAAYESAKQVGPGLLTAEGTHG